MVHWSLGNKVFRATQKYSSSWLAHSSFSGLPDFGLNILSASPPLYSYAKVTLRCCTDRCIKLLWQFMPPCRSNPLLKAFAMVTVVSGEIPFIWSVQTWCFCMSSMASNKYHKLQFIYNMSISSLYRYTNNIVSVDKCSHVPVCILLWKQ